MNPQTISIRKRNQPRPKFISKQIEQGEYYFLDLQPDEDRDLTIACGGIEQCAPDYKVDRTEFDYYGIEYIVTGKCRLVLEGQESTLQAGSFFGYGPHRSHAIENIGQEPLIKYFVDFTGSLAPSLFSKSPLGHCRSIHQPQCQWIKDAFQNLQECGLAGGKSAQSICGSLLNYLFARLEEIDTQPKPAPTPSLASFETCKSYVEHFYFKINGAHEIADACNISHPHLCRLFKRFSDETPSQMLLRLKLKHSLGLLQQGNLLVKEIAEQVGFEDQYYFSRRFKEYFGLSPRNYALNQHWAERAAS